MAILSLDLLHYSSQNRTSSSIEPRASHGHHRYLMSNDIRGINSTQHRISTTKSHRPKVSSTTSSSAKKPKKKIMVRKRKVTQNDTLPVASMPILSSKRPTPKSDTLMPFYAAQPMATFDISYHHPIYENYNPLVNGILNMNEHPLPVQGNPAQHQMPILPIVEPIPFKQLDPQHFQPIPPPGVQKIPILDPFNVLKQRKPVRYAGKPKFLPVVRALPQLTTTMPPISVTHIYKYEETNSGLPFENDDFVDNFPAISVALDDHLNDRAADIARLKGMMIPPKLHQQPIYYNMPIVELSTLAPVTLQNAEFDILHKFNEAIKSQNNQLQQQQQQLQQQQQDPSQGDDQQFEYDEESKESQDDKSYSDDDVKKALKYIQTLKKNRPDKPNRGSKKFDTERSQSKKRNKGKKEESEESFEEEEPERPKKSNKHKSPDFSAEDDNFTIVSFDELDGGESHKKVVKSKKKLTKADLESAPKADTIDNIGYQESQIVPSLDHEVITRNIMGI